MTLALVPLVGAALFARTEFNRAQQIRTQAVEVDELVDELVTLTRLRAALLDERNWTLSNLSLAEIGVPPEIASSQSGFDLVSEQANAITEVDALVRRLDRTQIREEITTIRRDAIDGGGSNEVADQFNLVVDTLRVETSAIFDDLLLVSGNVDRSGDLTTKVRILQTAVSLHASQSAQFASYFSAQFSAAERARGHHMVLNAETLRLAEGGAQMKRLVGPDSAEAAELTAIETNPASTMFAEAVTSLTEAGVSTTSSIIGGFATLMVDPGRTLAEFQAGASQTEAYLGLVELRSTDVTDVAAVMQQSAAGETRNAAWTVGVLIGLSLLFVGAMSVFVGRPLRRLAAAATALRDGEHPEVVDRWGPNEVLSATDAIHEASENLLLIEQQAHALAVGDLAHPVLAECAPGHLGDSLQRTVGTLRASLAEGEELRGQLEFDARHDPLTGLPNRAAALQELERSMASGSPFAVLFLDLDGFKLVNDRQGHLVGDHVLCAVASRLRVTAPVTDTVARLGGDEFLIVASGISSDEDAHSLAQDLVAAVAKPIPIGRSTVAVHASVGIATSNLEETASVESLLKQADLAVYQAKAQGPGSVVICDGSLLAAITHRDHVAAELEQAITNDELFLVYQPIVSAHDWALKGLEALVRWQHPTQGVLAPDHFIPVAEQSELIVALERWVLAEAARQLALWTNHPTFGTVPLSVNLSSRHLDVPSVASDVVEPLRRAGVEPNRLVIEITESILVGDMAEAAVRLDAIRRTGVCVAIDDFGTGYTSLAHLKNLPMDTIKIDRTFTSGDDESLVRLIVGTGHVLGASITAEGVETEEQARTLAALGCDTLQGYLFARPSRPEELAESVWGSASSEQRSNA